MKEKTEEIISPRDLFERLHIINSISDYEDRKNCVVALIEARDKAICKAQKEKVLQRLIADDNFEWHRDSILNTPDAI